MPLFKTELITASSPPSKVKMWAYQEAGSTFNDTKSITIASDCVEEGHKYIQSLSPNYIASISRKDLDKEITRHIKGEVAKRHYGTLQRVGIVVLAMIFWPITLDVLVAWAIIKIFDIHFGTKEIK